MTMTMKPIGVMKSLFQFKNGTPRQASICANAPGILTIERNVFNNPEHSLEGLEDYSHAWIIFVFHKNNNSYTKAKVKPPRLDGKRTGVFSSRSPYRPNNIGLSLVKIDKIEGATVYFSGVDMIDGTPVLDIKPYIPEYDYPVSTKCPETTNQQCLEEIKTFQEEAGTLDLNTHENNTNSNNIKSEARPANDIKELESGFLAMSSALDRAGDMLTSQLKRSDKIGEQSEVNPASHRPDSSPKKILKSHETETSMDDSVAGVIHGGDEDLDSFLENVLFHAVESLSSELPLHNSPPKSHKISKCVDAQTGSILANQSSHTASKKRVDSSNRKNLTEKGPDKSSAKGKLLKEPRESTEDDERENPSAYPVVAPWLLNPPVKKLRVTFTIEALQQLQQFSKSSQNPHYRLKLLSNSEEAEAAIRGVLHEEPRSVYRRQHCQDSLYFFTVDVVHITCWFDEDVAQVVRVKPIAAVSKLQHKLEGGIE